MSLEEENTLLRQQVNDWKYVCDRFIICLDVLKYDKKVTGLPGIDRAIDLYNETKKKYK